VVKVILLILSVLTPEHPGISPENTTIVEMKTEKECFEVAAARLSMVEQAEGVMFSAGCAIIWQRTA
jgi:hypothetical protein